MARIAQLSRASRKVSLLNIRPILFNLLNSFFFFCYLLAFSLAGIPSFVATDLNGCWIHSKNEREREPMRFVIRVFQVFVYNQHQQMFSCFEFIRIFEFREIWNYFHQNNMRNWIFLLEQIVRVQALWRNTKKKERNICELYSLFWA